MNPGDPQSTALQVAAVSHGVQQHSIYNMIHHAIYSDAKDSF